MSIIKRISEVKTSHMEKYQREREKEINQSFWLAEKDGKLYILHNGTAIFEFPSDGDVTLITSMIANVRKTAVEYEL